MKKDAAALVAAAKPEDLDPVAVEARLASGDAMLADIQEADELDSWWHIAGAVDVPKGMLGFRADPSTPCHQAPLDPSARVALHCAGGGRSALAAATSKTMGYDGLAHLDGMHGWTAAGKPVA